MCVKVIKVSDDSYKFKKGVENESANMDLSKTCKRSATRYSLFHLLSSAERCYFQ